MWRKRCVSKRADLARKRQADPNHNPPSADGGSWLMTIQLPICGGKCCESHNPQKIVEV